MSKRSGQATVEYLLLIVVISVIFWKVIVQVQHIFYGWGNQPGAIEYFIDEQVVNRLSSQEPGW